MAKNKKSRNEELAAEADAAGYPVRAKTYKTGSYVPYSNEAEDSEEKRLYEGMNVGRNSVKKPKKAQAAGSDIYMPIPPAPAPDTSAVDAVMGYTFPKGQRYPVTSKYQETGTYAPYTSRAMLAEEQKKVQDELLNEELKYMNRSPDSMKPAKAVKPKSSVVDNVMDQTFGDGNYPANPKYEGPADYEHGGTYPARPEYSAPSNYGQKPFDQPAMLQGGGMVSPNNPYQIDPGVRSPFKMSPIERQQMEEAIRKAMGGMGGQMGQPGSFEDAYRRR